LVVFGGQPNSINGAGNEIFSAFLIFYIYNQKAPEQNQTTATLEFLCLPELD